MDTSHLHRQKELDAALVNALIEATPESWMAFRLTLVFEGVGAGKEGIRHEISSLEGKSEVVCATPEMFEASFRISDHFRGLGRPLASAIYEAKALPSCEWSWHGEWSYETL